MTMRPWLLLPPESSKSREIKSQKWKADKTVGKRKVGVESLGIAINDGRFGYSWSKVRIPRSR